MQCLFLSALGAAAQVEVTQPGLYIGALQNLSSTEQVNSSPLHAGKCKEIKEVILDPALILRSGRMAVNEVSVTVTARSLKEFGFSHARIKKERILQTDIAIKLPSNWMTPSAVS